MKKIFFAFVVTVLFSVFLQAQEFSYGILGGADLYSINTKGGDFSSSKDGHLNINIGLFGNYHFTEKWSLKMNLLFNSSEEKYNATAKKQSTIGGPLYHLTYIGDSYFGDSYYFLPKGNRNRYYYEGKYPEKENYRIIHTKKQIHFSPLLVYHLGAEKVGSKRNFYLLGGPRISFLLSAYNNSINPFSLDLRNNWINGEKIDVTDFYASVNYGVQLGAGINFLKHFSFEILGDYGFSNILKDNATSAKTIGVSGLLAIDVSSLIL